MDTVTATHPADEPAPVAASVRRSRRRRPSGAPPPLPRHLEKTGVGWLLATVGLVAAFAISFAASRHGAAVSVTAADDRVARWLTELRSGWLTNALQVAAFPASWLACLVARLSCSRVGSHIAACIGGRATPIGRLGRGPFVDEAAGAREGEAGEAAVGAV
jgi:hypothetical protein